MELKAIYNAAIVKPIELEETTYGNIIVPDMGNEKNRIGEVIDVGPGHYSVTGDLIETVVKPGDVVVLPTMGFTRFDFKGDEYWVGPENQILCTIKK
jgi:co-chaperonin GroES (HSP10)